MKAKEKIFYWLELANYDLETASAMLETAIRPTRQDFSRT
jgi:hypothetical protein